VKFLRLLLICLGLLLVLVAVAFTPLVQTWIAQTMLDRRPGLQSSLGSLSARFGKVEIADLHLEAHGVVLTLPSLQARLPLTTAVRDGKLVVRSLVAKGWTLDLSRTPEPEAAPAHAVAAPETGSAAGPTVQTEVMAMQEVEQVFRGILGGWELPYDVSLDGVDLEGDVLIAVSPDRGPVQVHVIIKGGGMAAGHEGAFTIDAEAADPWLRANSVAAHGRLVVAMKSPRTFNRVEITADLSAQGGWFQEGFAVSADFAAAQSAGEETCTFDLSRGGRHLATFLARYADATRRVSGDWKIDLRDADLAPFGLDRPLPAMAAAGDGHFDADASFAQVHVLGRLTAVASHLGVLAPSLDRLGETTLAAHFDLARSGQSIRVNDLDVSLAGAEPVAAVQLLQPFDFDAKTGELKVADPHGDWLKGSVKGFPLAWLSGLTGRFTFAGGDATGEFVLQAANGGFTLRPKSPLTATGVSVQSAGRTLGRNLDLSLSLLADYGPEGWQVQWSPFTVGSGGRHLATSEGTASRHGGADQPVAIAGTWNADLDALVSQPAIPGVAWITARSASGEFSANVGTAMNVDGKFTVVGHDPSHSVTGSVRADIDANGEVSLLVPVKITIGKNESDLSAEGNWSGDETGDRINGRLTGENVLLDHLRLLAAPLAVAAGTGGAQMPGSGPDRIPFWGGCAGIVAVVFDHLTAGGQVFDEVGGTFDFDHGSIHLTNGRGGLPHQKPVEVEGLLSFDATAESPYSLKATAALNEVEAASLFGAAQPERDPVIEGRFAVAGTLTGKGINLDDLVRHTQEEFRLTSTVGIVRLLKTTVADAIPEDPTPVSDAASTAGSAVGWLLGLKKGSGEKTVSKTTDAVLNFTSVVSEIGYDRFTLTAIRGYDRTIRLVDIAMTAPEERLTGSGQITYIPGVALGAQPFSAELKLGVRGDITDLVAKAGLPTSPKDDQGYRVLSQPLHFGGTLEHIDASAWRELLVKAATRQPEGGKNGAEAARPKPPG
jgi:hypothetical protein